MPLAWKKAGCSSACSAVLHRKSLMQNNKRKSVNGYHSQPAVLTVYIAAIQQPKLGLFLYSSRASSRLIYTAKADLQG